MRIALVDSTPKAKLYPLPLLKIGAWRKSLGDDCKIFNSILPKQDEFDEIWITTTFTYHIPIALGIIVEAKKRAKRVWVGGISATLLPDAFKKCGVEIHSGLLPDAEKFNPDYELLEELPEYSIAHTSRGCVRKCGFCMVQKLEPKFKNRLGWERDIHPNTKKILFFDNNWIAKGKKGLKYDTDILKRLVSDGKINEIDFNQGLDARLMTEDIADLMQGLPINPVRFAFDNVSYDEPYQNAIRIMAKRNFKVFMAYVLYNFEDTPQDFYYRIRKNVELSVEHGIASKSFPMRFQPILTSDIKRGYVGKNWTLKKRNAVNTILSKHSLVGQISCQGGKTTTPIEEFEYWFGKDANEFDMLLSYPKIRQLMERKKGNLKRERQNANLKGTKQ